MPWGHLIVYPNPSVGLFAGGTSSAAILTTVNKYSYAGNSWSSGTALTAKNS